MIIRPRWFLWLSFGTLVACAKDPPPPPAAVTTAAPRSAPLRLGAPISADATPIVLSELATHSAAYRDKTVSTSGVVTSVCQEMGCWMEIKDDKGFAHVRMHGHSFFVPKTASGHHARVEATVVGAEEPTECAEGSDAGAALTKIDLDATGIELD